MKPHLILLLAWIPTLGAQTAWWNGTWDDALAEARRRNVPLLIAINVDGEEANERAVAFYGTPEFAALSSRCVPIIASVGSHEDAKGRSGPPVCGRFGSVTCGHHRALEARIRKQFFGGPEVPIPAPHHLVVQPDLNVSWRDAGDVPSIDAVQGALAKVQAALGRGLSAAQAAEADALLQRLREARERSEPATVLKDAAALQGLGAGTPHEAAWKALEQEVHRDVERALEAWSDQAKSGNALDALRGLDSWAPHLRGTPFERPAKKLTSEIRSTPVGREAAKMLEREARALPFLELAREAERAGEWTKAVRQYEVITARAPGTPLAERAAARLGELERDRDLGPIVREERRRRAADEALAEARRLAKQSPAEGRIALRKVAEDYPGTPAATSAEKLLGGGD